MRVLYLAVDGILCPAFDSQVLSEVLGLQRAGLDARLVVWTPGHDSLRSADKAAEVSAQLAGRVALLERGLHLGRLSVGGYLRSLAPILHDWGWDDDRPLLVYARSPMAGVIALAWRHRRPNVRVVTDYRGFLYEEYRQALARLPLVRRAAGRFVLRELRHHEIQCARRSDAIRCLSTPWKQTIVDAFGAREDRVTVVPCYVNTDLFHFTPQERSLARAELGIEPDRFVVVFSGSLGAGYGYSAQRVIETYRTLRSRRPCVLLVISPHAQDARDALGRSDLPEREVRLMSGSIRDVARWCQAGDLGLILLPCDQARRVSCPIKFAEYLRAGMKVLATPNLGDLPRWIPQLRVGAVVDLDQGLIPLDLTEPLDDAERLRVSQAGGDLLGHGLYLPRIISLYHNTLRGSV